MNQPREDNIEFIRRLLEQSPTGALAQVFVMNALLKWSSHVVDEADDLRVSMARGIVNADAWIRTAEHFKEEIEERLGFHHGPYAMDKFNNSECMETCENHNNKCPHGMECEVYQESGTEVAEAREGRIHDEE